MKFAELSNRVFDESVAAYHTTDHVDAPQPTPYEKGTPEAVLFAKNWIDAVQWHLEDIIRNPDIDPVEALAIKRRIDQSGSHRHG